MHRMDDTHLGGGGGLGDRGGLGALGRMRKGGGARGGWGGGREQHAAPHRAREGGRRGLGPSSQLGTKRSRKDSDETAAGEDEEELALLQVVRLLRLRLCYQKATWYRRSCLPCVRLEARYG